MYGGPRHWQGANEHGVSHCNDTTTAATQDQLEVGVCFFYLFFFCLLGVFQYTYTTTTRAPCRADKALKLTFKPMSKCRCPRSVQCGLQANIQCGRKQRKKLRFLLSRQRERGKHKHFPRSRNEECIVKCIENMWIFPNTVSISTKGDFSLKMTKWNINKNSRVWGAGVSAEYANQALALLIFPTFPRYIRSKYTESTFHSTLVVDWVTTE